MRKVLDKPLKGEHVKVNMSAPIYRHLKEISERDDVSMSTVCLQLIKFALQKRGVKL